MLPKIFHILTAPKTGVSQAPFNFAQMAANEELLNNACKFINYLPASTPLIYVSNPEFKSFSAARILREEVMTGISDN